MPLLVVWIVVALGIFAIVSVPAWWLASRVVGPTARPIFRLIVALGLALVGYLTFVNLIGRLTGQSLPVASAYLVANAGAALYLWMKRRSEIELRPLARTRRDWLPILGIAGILAIPQWILAVSSPYWDEVVASSIHLTAANQFAENVYPPRHNALPDVVIKYHYGFTLLSGTIHWLTGLTANVSIDLASSGLWLFSFLFVVFWLMEMGLDRRASLWGGFATLYGGGLAWMYARSTEVYSGNEVLPTQGILHQYRRDLDWIGNAVDAAKMPSAHLRNWDGSLSHLPWDISAQVQQHAVMLGIALTVLAMYLFISWQAESPRKTWKGVLTSLVFAAVPLGHAVFGAVVVLTAGIVLFSLWVRERTTRRFAEGALFGLLTGTVAVAHGGFFQSGPEYGSNTSFLTLRHGFGYFRGGLIGFFDWNVAGFGIPLFLAIFAWVVAWRRRKQRPETRAKIEPEARARRLAFLVLTIFAGFSYLLPQFAYYTSDSTRQEIATEISKFFFAAHLGLALISAFGAAALLRYLPSFALLVLGALAVVSPLAFVYANSVDLAKNGEWLGFYFSPYAHHSIEEQMGTALLREKKSAKEVYFDASGDERGKTSYLNELLIFGGSVFTLTPSNYETDGLGFRLSSALVGRRLAESSRVRRLKPGSIEDSACSWYYARPDLDLAYAPMLVRSRFRKAVDQGYFVDRLHALNGGRVLYRVDKPTRDLDRQIEKFWQPRIVMATRTRGDLYFYDYAHGKIVAENGSIDLPERLRDDFVQILIGRFDGASAPTLVAGRMLDTEYHLGERPPQFTEKNDWTWSRLDRKGRAWGDEKPLWNWALDVPLVADVDGHGTDSVIAYHPETGDWFRAPGEKLSGPKLEAETQALPLAGKFLKGASSDLGLWSPRTGKGVIQNAASGERAEFALGGQPGQILVTGDFNGDGRDEIGLWDRVDQTWTLRLDAKGSETRFKFGTVTSIPVPADYNGDGRTDVAYWEPDEGKIHVSFDRGRTEAKTIPVPAGSLPIFVHYE